MPIPHDAMGGNWPTGMPKHQARANGTMRKLMPAWQSRDPPDAWPDGMKDNTKNRVATVRPIKAYRPQWFVSTGLMGRLGVPRPRPAGFLVFRQNAGPLCAESAVAA